MYVYILTETEYNDAGDACHVYTVGFYDPRGNWHTDSDHHDQERAAHRVAWLNGSGREAAK